MPKGWKKQNGRRGRGGASSSSSASCHAAADGKGKQDQQHPHPTPASSSNSSSSPSNQSDELDELDIYVEVFRAMTLEDQEMLIQQSRDKDPDKLLEKQFIAAPYFDSYGDIVLAAGATPDAKAARHAADQLWKIFKQASQLGQWAPGRIHLLYHTMRAALGLYEKNQNDQEHSQVLQKDVQRMQRLFKDNTELTVIRVIAATILYCMPGSVMISPEEKMEIVRAALILEPTPEECTRRVFFQDKIAPVLKIIEDHRGPLKEQVEHILKYSPCQSFDQRDFFPPDALAKFQQRFKGETGLFECLSDPDLHRRTFEIGGCKCDYCHKTVEELGVTKLKLCGKCSNAFYCGADCQRKAWKEGHKQACRPAGDIREGDLMRLVGLKEKPELNGCLVIVFKQCDDSDRWTVGLLSRMHTDCTEGPEISVKAESLDHIRPAA